MGHHDLQSAQLNEILAMWDTLTIIEFIFSCGGVIRRC
jgi:hypothetical protein